MTAQVEALVSRIVGPDAAAASAARRRLDRLAKPPGSLGALEEVAVRLAAMTGNCPPAVPSAPHLLVAVADHGVHGRGVSRWPQALTGTVAATVADGRAAAGVLARHVGAQVTVLDVGLVGERPAGVVDARVRSGTRDLASEPAMTPLEAARAVEAGADAADRLVAAGVDLLALGEVGIANTTASAALLAAVTAHPAREVTGRGADADPTTLARKVAVVEEALRRHGPGRDPMAVLASLGGLEHAALVGAILAGAGRRIPVVLDGVTTVAAAVVAAGIAPRIGDHLVAGHRSPEPGAGIGLAHLGLRPLLELDLCLGEGTGALLAIPLLQAAARLVRDMARLDEL